MNEESEARAMAGPATMLDRRLAIVLDNMPGALVYANDDLDIVFCNERFREMYDRPVYAHNIVRFRERSTPG